MAPSARIFTDYRVALKTVIEEEYVGEGYFATLADIHTNEASDALHIMAEIERAVITALQSVIHRNHLQLQDRDSLRDEGRREAEGIRLTSWPDILKHIVDDYPVFLEEFEQIAGLGPKTDAAELQLLVDHEIAVIDFATAALQGEPNSIEILEQFLNRIS